MALLSFLYNPIEDAFDVSQGFLPWDYVALGDTLTIPENRQMNIIDELVLDGELILDGSLNLL